MVVTLVAALALAGFQTGRMFPTIEGIVGGSHAVYVGSVTKVEFQSAPDNLNRRRAHVTVRVDERLKGPKAKELSVDFTPSFPEFVLAKFAQDKTQFLWVSPPEDSTLRDNLKSKMATHEVPAYLWFRTYDLGSIERYVDYDSRVFTADLRVISTWPDFLVEARRAAKKYPKVVELTHLGLPHAVIRMCGDPNAFGVLRLPKDDNLKTLCRRLSSNPAQVIAEACKKSRSVYMEPHLTEQDVVDLKKVAEATLRELGPTR